MINLCKKTIFNMSSKIIFTKLKRTRATSLSCSPTISYMGGNPNKIVSWRLEYNEDNNSKENIIRKIDRNRFLRRGEKWMR